MDNTLNSNTKIHGFSLLEKQYIDELKAEAYLFEHDKSGARLFYVAADDDNKVFSVSFRTVPKDNTGVAHILEHSVLCGSRKFPLKEPFVELVKGSLNTFLNAMTYPDKTMYPVASKNDKDFRNLMDVYLDAVFYPRVLETPEIVMQEGWHYEMDSLEDPITYKGVVYNEMKGVYSSPTSILDKCTTEVLFPHTTYGVDSGGDPDYITDLTFENFVAFYKENYHPSNSYFYLFGKMDLVDQLRFINEEYLQNFDRLAVKTQIDVEPPFEKAVEASFPYNISSEESETKKCMHSLAYTFPPSTPEFNLAFEILNYVLVGSPSAPLRELLVKEGVGNDISGSFVDGIYQPIWNIVVTGAEREANTKLKDIVSTYLQKTVKNGLDKKSLEAALNYFEFVLREADFGGHPRGLIYNIRAMGEWLYDGSPFDALRYEDVLKHLRAGLQTRYYEEIIEKYILQNEHNALVTVYPEKGLTARKEEKEREFLAVKKANMSDEELQAIVDSTKALKARQAAVDSPEDLAKIPLLELSDLQLDVEEIRGQVTKVEGAQMHFVPTNTQGISYANYYFNMDVLDESEICYANLLADILSRMNSAYHSYVDLDKTIQFYLGGLSFGVTTAPVYSKDKEYESSFVVRAKALDTNISHVWSIVDEILNYTILEDKSRLEELVEEIKAVCNMSIFQKGHTVASNIALAAVDITSKIENSALLGYLEFLATLVENKDYVALGRKLKVVADKLFRTAYLNVLYIGSNDGYKHFEEIGRTTLQRWEHATLPCEPFVFTKEFLNEGIATSSQVQYVAKGGSFKEHGFSFNGSMKVLEMILKYEYLWTRIRVQGGAYGAFATFKKNGTLLFCSYRDPNLIDTFKVYDEMSDYVQQITLTERELRKYIIGTMSGLDMPSTPYLRGIRYMNQYFTGTSAKDIESLYKEVVNTTEADLRQLAPVIKAVVEDNHVCVFGNEERVRNAKEYFDRLTSLPN